ncbi:MAG: DUF4129 domain-containing protein [Candidatus Heimdallarchaeaceae archaeon]
MCLISSSYAQIAVDVNSNNIEKNNQINSSHDLLSPPDYIIKMLDGDHDLESFLDSDTIPSETQVEETSLDSKNPVYEHLTVTIRNTEENTLDPDLGGTDELIAPIPADKIVRGTTVTVAGRLWGGITGRFWDNEMVYLYYNITESQYEGNQLFYFGNGQYEIGSDLTDSNGEFSIDLVTSDLTSSPFSKVGDINLLTWFNGSTAERLAGTPGAKNVTFFGQMDIQHVASVTNPNVLYSFITSIVFENGTIVQTSGTNYNLDINWQTDGSDHTGTHAFTILHQHLYSDTAPGPSGENVYYSASYNINQLGINFFVENDTHTLGVITSEDYTINTNNVLYQTEETLVVDAFFDFTGVYLKGPQEIQMGSTIDFYANLSSSTGLVTGRDVDIFIQYGTSTIYSHTNTTDGSGEITFSVYFDPSTYTDITQGISILFRFYHSDFFPARFLNDTLTTVLAVDIMSVTLALDDNTRYYTNSMSLGFNVVVLDVNLNPAQSSRFQLIFPGIGTEEIVTATGSEDVSKIVPPYIIQNDFETIIVTAMFEDGGHYKYYAPGSPSDNGAFNIYHSLTLTLSYPNTTVVATASTNEFNNTYWPQFESPFDQYYRLTAVDQSGRDPIGAELTISFAGSTMSAIVAAGVNYVDWGYASLTNSSTLFDSDEAYLGDLIATGGAMPTPPSITLSVNVFGPDNSIPDISNVILTPDPSLLIPHEPYYNITFTVTATDTGGSGMQFVNISVDLRAPGGSWVIGVAVLQLTNIGPNTYEVTLNVPPALAQYYVRAWVYAIDYAGHGVNSVGSKQTNPASYYSTDILDCNWFIYPTPIEYQVGDAYGPVEESLPDIDGSTNPYDPYVDITVYMNDSVVYTGMDDVRIRVDRYNTITEIMEYYYVSNVSMTRLSENVWFYTLDMDYNYEYDIYYFGVDTAGPFSNESPLGFYGPYEVEAVDTTAPSISPFAPIFNGTIADPDTVITFNITITDSETSVSTVILSIDITMGETVYYEDYLVVMTRVGVSDVFTAQVDLSDFSFTRSGTYALQYSITATDGVGNSDTVSNSMGVLNEVGGLGISNLGAIIGGVIGGIVVLLAGLFLYFNRHTIKTYTKKQTFKRRLKDYLREIIEDIKKDGLEGRYREGLLKSWSVLEGIGREFYDLPRYRSQTPTEFARLLAYRGKIESELVNTLLLYFEKARYGHEEITEKDFNTGVRALLKLVDKIEIGEMKIES